MLGSASHHRPTASNAKRPHSGALLHMQGGTRPPQKHSRGATGSACPRARRGGPAAAPVPRAASALDGKRALDEEASGGASAPQRLKFTASARWHLVRIPETKRKDGRTAPAGVGQHVASFIQVGSSFTFGMGNRECCVPGGMGRLRRRRMGGVGEGEGGGDECIPAPVCRGSVASDR